MEKKKKEEEEEERNGSVKHTASSMSTLTVWYTVDDPNNKIMDAAYISPWNLASGEFAADNTGTTTRRAYSIPTAKGGSVEGVVRSARGGG